MKFNDKKALIFDFDGTLIDSAPDIALAGNLMLEALGKDTFAQATFRQWIGNGARTMVHRALSGSTEIDSDIDPQSLASAIELFLSIYREHCCVETVLYPGVLETLKTLQSRGYPLVIVTNKPIEFVEPINRFLKMHGLFVLILGGDSLEKKKPDPLPLFHVCQHLGIEVGDALMIGDSKNDILAANNAQMDSVGVSYGYNYGEDIGIYQPSHVIDKFDELLELL